MHISKFELNELMRSRQLRRGAARHSLLKELLPLICLCLVAANTVGAQTPVMTVASNASACELNAASFDNLVNLLRSNNEHIFIIARLGSGERARDLNRRRLSNVRTYFADAKIDPGRFTFAAGSKVDGEGRVEFYIGSTLWLLSYVRTNRDICVDCCDYPDPRYYGMGKRDRPRRRGR